MMFYFDADKFLLLYSKKTTNIETIHIARWVECSLRHVQKWAEKKGIPYRRNHGRKFYIWDEEAVRRFATFINRKHDRAEALRGRIKNLKNTETANRP